MSHDFRVFLARRPELADVLGHPAHHASADAADRTWTIESAQGLACTIDGPFEVEDEDLPDCVARAMLAARWVVEFSVPATSSKTAFASVQRTARAIARDAAGVVYDPQDDAVLWPRSPKGLRSAPARARPGDRSEIRLEWAFARRLNADDGERLMALLGRWMPEALPRRFGDFEPLQGRVERDGRAPFTAMWNGSGSVFWMGTRPFTDGHMSPCRGWGSALDPAAREAARPIVGGRKRQAVDGITLAFSTAILEDPRWILAVTTLFRTVAAALGPFMAAGYADPHPSGEPFKLSAIWWYGLPGNATWLTYVGEPYLPALQTKLSTVRAGAGVVVQDPAGPHGPLRSSRRALGWPVELVRGGTQLDEDQAARTIPDLAPLRLR